MVKGFGLFPDRDVAFYAGILVSSFALAEALSGCFWGALSDRIGRKPVLLLGMFGTMCSMVLFGLATNFWMALAARTLGGLLNGNIGVIQTMVGELVTNPAHEPRAYAVMPFVWSIGTVLGPAVAALTADTALFPTRPYLLPNLICAALLLMSIVIGYFFLKETRTIVFDVDTQVERAETESILAVGGATTDAGVDLRGESYGTFNAVAIHEEPTWKVRSNGHSRPSSLSSVCDRAFTRRVTMLVVSLGIYCYHSMAFNHLLPIFAQDERSGGTSSIFHVSGGLGLSTQTVGVILSVNGVISLLIQGIVFPLLAGWLGVWRLFRVCVVFFPVVYFLVPYLAILPSSAMMPGIYACMTTWDFFNIIVYPLLLILIKEAANPRALGRINGLAASIGAAARCLSPPIVGEFYSIGYDIEFEGLAWWCTGAVAVLGAVQLVTIERKKSTTATISSQFVDEVEYESKEVIHILVEDVEPGPRVM